MAGTAYIAGAACSPPNYNLASSSIEAQLITPQLNTKNVMSMYNKKNNDNNVPFLTATVVYFITFCIRLLVCFFSTRTVRHLPR